jgi:hypothetical protein
LWHGRETVPQRKSSACEEIEMRFWFRFSLSVLPSVFLLLATLSGCNSEGERPKIKPWPSEEDEKPLVELKAKEYGPVSGTVVLDDGFNPPAPELLAMGQHSASCHADYPEGNLNIGPRDWETNPTWIVTKENRGVKNAVKNAIVYLQPPEGQYFYVPEEQRNPANVTLEQPHCAFIPRVFVLFPSYYDGKKGAQEPTGQALVIKSSLRITHNYSIGSAGVKANTSLAAGAKEAVVNAKADIEQQLMMVKCDIHGWMRAYGCVLDHPFAAVTNDKGEFKIENAPLGVKLQVIAWHEGGINQGYFLKGGKAGDQLTLTDKGLPPLKVRGY